ncbi:MAG: alpha/beta hydrolase family protein [Planctomycetaceae bacterium]
MTVELVDVQTEDGIRLHGALQSTAAHAQELVICLHGVGSNFYGSTMMNRLSDDLACDRRDVLRVNTRGHDSVFAAHTPTGPTRLGAAYEVVDHCRLDVSAWIDWGQARSYQRVILLGHSLGAIKALYAQRFQPHPIVHAVVAISPPRLAAGAFRQSARSSEYLESLMAAERMLEQDRGSELIEIRFPFPMVISAASFHDKYGPRERYNILNFVQHIRCPSLYVYGGQELESGGPAFAGLPEAIQKQTAERRLEGCRVETHVVPGADHLYTRSRDEMCRVVSDWLHRITIADSQHRPLTDRPD